MALINTLYLLPGVRSRSAREALNLSGLVTLVTGALLAGGWVGLPVWTPLAGLARAAPGMEGWVAVATTFAGAGLLLVVTLRLMNADSLVPPSQT